MPSLPAWIALFCAGAVGAWLWRIKQALDAESARMEPRGEKPDVTEQVREERPLAGTALR